MKSLVRKSNSVAEEKGATLVEFVLVLIVTLGVIGFMIDSAVAYFHYHLLVHANAATVRRLAVNVQGATSEPDLANLAETMVDQRYRNAYGVQMPSADFAARIERTPDAACLLRVRAEMPFRCFFCVYFDGPFNLITEAEALIEDECFTC